MRWVKERVMEYEWKDPSYTETVHRIYVRLRSDGSMWYQLVRRGGFYDREPMELENKFSRFLVSDVPVGVHSGSGKGAVVGVVVRWVSPWYHPWRRLNVDAYTSVGSE